MDVEKIQKINALALELFNQGLAGDRDEAIRQAEQIFTRKDYTSLGDQIKENNTSSEELKNKPAELNQEKIQNILQKNTDFIVKRMKEFKDQIVEMSSNFDALRGELDIINGRIKELQLARNNAPQNSTTAPRQPEAPAQQQLPRGDQDNHPRSGNFKDNEISIEKFFYSGSKPKN